LSGILAVGLGNTLMGDDGCGEAVVALLRRRLALPGFRAVVGGTDVSRLRSVWRGEPEVWLIDAFVGGHVPGTLLRLGYAELRALAQRHEGAHSLSLPECLRWLALGDPELAAVRFRLWGIEPLRIAPGPLSDVVARAAVRVAGEIHAKALCRLAPRPPAGARVAARP